MVVLEAPVPCPHCDTENTVPVIPPWLWYYWFFGVKCYHCGQTFDPYKSLRMKRPQ